MITKNFQTTTIFYYTFFLPGIVLYEFTYWIIAGVFNVQASQSLKLPEKQEMGELKLNFVKLSKKASPWKVSIITLSPVIIGLVIVWFISNNILNIDDKLTILQTLNLDTFETFISELTGTTDFWLWSYILFTIINTLTPDYDAVKSWMWGFIIFVSMLGFLILLGVDQTTGTSNVFQTVANGLNGLSSVIAVMLVLDSIAVAMLGILESAIEWITGDSATFKNGKMITMTRAEALEQRQKDRQSRRVDQKRRLPDTSGPPSIYKLELPIPSAPGKEPVSQKPSGILSPSSPNRLTNQGSTSERRVKPNVVAGNSSSEESIRIRLPGQSDEINEEDDDSETTEDITYEDVEDSV